MNKRERLEQTINGAPTDRPPVALWRYFPGDDQRAADFAQSLVRYQQQYDWDFVVAMPSVTYMLRGYGVHDVWDGAASGERTITKTVIQRSLQWTEIRTQDPMRGDFAKQIEALRLLDDAFGGDVPFVQVVYSPLLQAARLAGLPTLLDHLRRQPDRLRTGLNILTETTLQFMDALRRNTQIAGIFYVTDHASYDMLSEAEYRTFGLPYDRKLLEMLPSTWWLNTLQVNGKSPMLHLFAQMPIQVINWADRDARPSLERAIGDTGFSGAICGGIAAHEHLLLGTPAIVREVGRDALIVSNRRRLILGCGGFVPVTAPVSNLRAVRALV